jgi:hypothetical protein
VHTKKVRRGHRARGGVMQDSAAARCPKSFSPRPLRERGRGVRVHAVTQRSEWRSKQGRLFLGPPQKTPPMPVTCCHFATQSEPQNFVVATSTHFVSCNKLKKSLIGIRGDVAILGLGKNSGTSGDFQPTRPTQRSRKVFPGRNLTFAESTGGVRQFVRLKPTVAAYPRNRGQRLEVRGQSGNRKRLAFLAVRCSALAPDR